MTITSPRIRTGIALCLLVCLLFVSCTAPANEPAPPTNRGDVIYQVGTLNALLEREYEATDSVGALLRHGSLGLGTVDGLDGEMVIVDGTAYAIRDDGRVDQLGPETGIPFGVVTPFEADTTVTLSEVDSFSEFQSGLDAKMPSPNALYAFRVTGDFDHLETRSVTAQQPPYPKLETVIANQTRFTFEGTTGTMVGFRIADVFEGVNTVGHHAHFVTADRDGGGHVLDIRSSDLTVQIDRSASLQVHPRGSAVPEE